MESVEKINKKIQEKIESGIGNAFFVFDVENVKLKFRQWVEKIPRVDPFYAVKCNNHIEVLKGIADMGGGFDCASKLELEQVLALGVHPEKIIFANTVKKDSDIQFAAKKNVRKVTFDSSAELLKIQEFHPTAQVILRIRFDASNFTICLGTKFGCNPVSEAPDLIKLCKTVNANLIGISFHVGSGTQDYGIYESALATVRGLFNLAENYGFKLNFVDIGGGFIGSNRKFLNLYARSINTGIEKYFSDLSVNFISEPGRYFVDSSFALAAQVTLKKVSVEGHYHYFINESIFMSFMASFMNINKEPEFQVIQKSILKEKKKYLSTIWGCSCSSNDKIIENAMISEMEIGDWLVFNNMGAYSTSMSTSFNGFKVGDIFELNE
jgi:ornithine decarboxylase